MEMVYKAIDRLIRYPVALVAVILIASRSFSWGLGVRFDKRCVLGFIASGNPGKLFWCRFIPQAIASFRICL
jgi:hypothetical protein